MTVKTRVKTPVDCWWVNKGIDTFIQLCLSEIVADGEVIHYESGDKKNCETSSAKANSRHLVINLGQRALLPAVYGLHHCVIHSQTQLCTQIWICVRAGLCVCVWYNVLFFFCFVFFFNSSMDFIFEEIGHLCPLATWSQATGLKAAPFRSRASHNGWGWSKSPTWKDKSQPGTL